MSKKIDLYISKQEQYYNIALKEIKKGRKESHWMWYIFPQIIGLGKSSLAIKYAILNKEEAKEYFNNDYLRNNLIKISKALLNIKNKDIEDILEYPDDLKLKSCLTLFIVTIDDKYEEEIKVLKDVLDKYYDGNLDDKTIAILEEQEKE